MSSNYDENGQERVANAAGSQVDGHSAAIGATTDAEATGNGTLIAITKRNRTMLAGGLPGALGTGGGLKVEGSGTELPTTEVSKLLSGIRRELKAIRQILSEALGVSSAVDFEVDEFEN